MEDDDYSQVRPICYGQLDTVFPLTESGLREIPDECRACGMDHDCLKLALKTPEGRRFLAERAGASSAGSQEESPSAVVGFLKRWSDRKLAGQKKKA
jgi:hypothetical protein